MPQVIGKTSNQNILFSFLVKQIVDKKPFEVWSQTRKSIIDVDDVYTIALHIVKNDMYRNSICNIFNDEYILVIDLVKIIERYFNTKGIYKLTEIDASYQYDSRCLGVIKPNVKVDFSNNYYENILKKYY